MGANCIRTESGEQKIAKKTDKIPKKKPDIDYYQDSKKKEVKAQKKVNTDQESLTSKITNPCEGQPDDTEKIVEKNQNQNKTRQIQELNEEQQKKEQVRQFEQEQKKKDFKIWQLQQEYEAKLKSMVKMYEQKKKQHEKNMELSEFLIKNLKEQVQKQSKEIIQLKKNQEQKEDEIRSLNLHKSQNQAEFNNLINEKSLECQEKSEKIQSLLKEKITIKRQFDSERSQLEEQILIYQKKIEELQRELQNCNRNSSQTTNHSEFEEMVEKINELKGTVDTKQKQLHEKSSQSKKIIQQYKHLQSSNKELKSHLEKLRSIEKKYIETKYELEDVKQLNQKLAQDLQEAKDSSRYRTKSFVQHKTFFAGDILENFKFEKKYLIEKIHEHMKRTIESTKILYQFKQDQKVNFHQRIDSHQNLVVIVQTADGMLIAGYYSDVYADKTSMKSEALILSLTNYKYFPINTLKNNPKKDKKDMKPMLGMVYDKYFLIYGNSEIRIKSGEKKLFSNFGINNSYFFSRGQTVNILLGQGKKNEVELVNYQIYQVKFETQY